MKKHPTYVIGNWKMNPSNLSAAQKLFQDIKKATQRRQKNVSVIVAPPFPFISEIHRLLGKSNLSIAAQDVFFELSGAHTGEVSLPMLKSVGVESVIVGHSERRARGESDDDIYRDIQLLLKYKTKAIICVGEKERDEHGHYFSVVERELRTALKDVKPSQLKNIVIAYEPIWAIGTGNTATASDAHEMKLFIQKILFDLFGRKAALSTGIIYGGSVNTKNAKELLEVGEVDGFLVGGASLKAAEFTEIVKFAEEYHLKS